MAHLLEVIDLNVWFTSPGRPDVHAVRGASLALDSRERTGLVGESGCGKSTTILAMMGLLPSSAIVSGQVLVNGVDILASGDKGMRPSRWLDMAMVFQGAMNAFNPVVKVHRQIAAAIRIRGGQSKRQAFERARELLQTVGIPRDRLDSYPHELSGGMRQRAAIALALSCEPRVLLADEPTTALDVLVQAQIMELLQRLCEEQGLALILVSHDLPLVAQVCERINVMYAGEVVEHGTVDQLYETPAHPYTRLLLAATPDLDSEEDLASIPGIPPRLDRPVVGCPFHARCDRVFDLCYHERPVLKLVVVPDHSAACHLNDQPPVASQNEIEEAHGRTNAAT